MGRFDHLDVATFRCQQHHAPPHLRHAIAGAVDDIEPDLVAETFQSIDKVMEHYVLGDCGNVLHRDDVWTSALCQASEFIQETPLSILAVQLVALCIGREGLAWSATCENHNVCITEQRFQFGHIHFADVPLDESSLVVGFVGKAAGRIQIDTGDHR